MRLVQCLPICLCCLRRSGSTLLPATAFFPGAGKCWVLLSIAITAFPFAGHTEAPSCYVWPPFPESPAGLSKLKVERYCWLVRVTAGRAAGCRAAVASAWRPVCELLPHRPGAKKPWDRHCWGRGKPWNRNKTNPESLNGDGAAFA